MACTSEDPPAGMIKFFSFTCSTNVQGLNYVLNLRNQTKLFGFLEFYFGFDLVGFVVMVRVRSLICDELRHA